MEFSQVDLENITRFLSNYSQKSAQVYWLATSNLKKLIYINDSYEKIWCRSSDVIYKDNKFWIDYLHEEDKRDHHPLHDMAKNVLNLGANAKFTETYRIIRPNKEVRWIIDRGHSICDNIGNIIAVTGVAIDITEEKRIFENTTENFFSLSLQGKLNKQIPYLTNRELQCISFLMKGHSTKMIANKLNLSVRTVEYYIENIKQKFCCGNKSKLIEKCWEYIL